MPLKQVPFSRCMMPTTTRSTKGDVVNVQCTLIAGHEGRCGFAHTMIFLIRQKAALLGKRDIRRVA